MFFFNDLRVRKPTCKKQNRKTTLIFKQINIHIPILPFLQLIGILGCHEMFYFLHWR